MKLAVAGAGGRMGAALIEAIQADGALELAAALDAPGSPALGRELGGIKVISDVPAAVSVSDVLIDFTRPEGTMRHLDACLKHEKALVIGTTGFSAAQMKTIGEAGKRAIDPARAFLRPSVGEKLPDLRGARPRVGVAQGDEFPRIAALEQQVAQQLRPRTIVRADGSQQRPGGQRAGHDTPSRSARNASWSEVERAA